MHKHVLIHVCICIYIVLYGKHEMDPSLVVLLCVAECCSVLQCVAK